MKAKASSLDQDVNALVEQIQRKEVAVFCGAGISRKSGIPIVHDIESYVLQRLGAPAEEVEMLLASSLPFEAFMEALDSGRSISKLLEVFSGGQPNTNHRLIAALAKAGLLRTISTTNFDLLIEHALETAGLREGQGFSRYTKRNDFQKIDWSGDALRFVKLHGSIENAEEIAVTLRQVAGKVWTQGTHSVIERLFSTGEHAAVLILGYSCSDLFDLSPQIESLTGPQRRVLLVDHETGAGSTENLAVKSVKNPFRRWKNGRRLRVDTDWLVTRIRERCIKEAFDSGEALQAPDWRAIVDTWAPDLGNAAGKAEAEYLLGTVLVRISRFALAQQHFQRGLDQATDDKLRARCHIGLALTNEELAAYDATIAHAKAAIETGASIADESIVRAAKMALGVAFLNRSQLQQAEPLIREAAPDEKEAISSPELAISALNNLGVVRLGLGEFDGAISTFETSANITAALGDKREEGNAWTNIGNVQNTRGDNRAALQSHQTALEIYRSIGDRWGEIAALNHVGVAHKNLGDYVAAIEHYQASLKLAEQMDDTRGLMFAHASLGQAFLDRGQPQDALREMDEALTLSDRVDDAKSKAGLLLNLSQAYIGLGEPVKANDCVEGGIEIAKRIGDVALITHFLGTQANLYSAGGDLAKAYEIEVEVFERAEKAGLKKVMAVTLQNIGSTLSDLGQLEQAFQATQGALELARKIGDGSTEARALNGLGLIYKRTGDFEAAIQFYEAGLSAAQRLGNRSIERTCLGNLAIAYGKVGRMREMQETAQRSLELAREIGDRNGEARQLGTLGNAYAASNDPEGALKVYKEALALFRATGARREEAMSLDNIASTLANLGQFREALEWFRQAHEVAVETYAPEEKFVLALSNKIAAAQQAAVEKGPKPSAPKKGRGS
jgi:tetratricopeptide (TPR) repeat protein